MGNSLVAADDIRTRLSFDSTTIITNALQASVESATRSMVALIRTEFDPTDYTDYFCPRYMLQRGQPLRHIVNVMEGVGWTDSQASGAFVILRLKAGFVNGSVSLSYAATMDDFTAGTDTDIENAILDTEKGVLVVRDLELRGMFIKAGYNAGFTLEGGVYQAIPEWLKQAAYTMSVIRLDEEYPGLRQDRAADPGTIASRMSRLQESIQEHIRYVPNCERPFA